MSEQRAKLSRRNFLKATGVATGGVIAAGALAVPVFTDSQLRADYPRVPGNKVDLPPNGKSVIIIGGGLAGLQAGVELSMRGFKVTVLEKSGSPGGKLKTWRDKAFGPPEMPEKQQPEFKGLVRDHGLHAVWGFYNNLREFLHRYGWGLAEMPASTSIYHFLDKDGTYSVLPNTNLPPPYNHLQLAHFANQLQHVDKKDRSQFMHLFAKFATFDYADPAQRAYLDSMTFVEYGKRMGLADSLVHKICDSIIEMAYFDNADKASALTMANLLSLVAGSPDDMKVNLYLDPPQETFLEPMAELIRSRGGEVHYNAEIASISTDGSRVTHVTTAAYEQAGLQRCSVCGAIIFGGVELGACPFCGANIDMIAALTPEESAERHFEADYFISALDIPAAQKFFEANLEALGGHDYFKKIQNLHAKSVFVVNLWFEGFEDWDRLLPNDKETALCFFATGFDRLGITINRGMPWRFGNGVIKHHFEDYAGRNVSVIETQIAKAEAVAGLTSEEIAAQCYLELKSVMPDLPPYRSFFVNRWHHYTAYRVGDEANRPPVQSPIDNLLLIGDMAFVPHPAVFMEKTNVTAKWATNLILEKADQKEGRIEILPCGTRNPALALLKRTASVYL
jgi:uncharacterized protein with NAD-binding domain and iron-sulfur cluster